MITTTAGITGFQNDVTNDFYKVQPIISRIYSNSRNILIILITKLAMDFEITPIRNKMMHYQFLDESAENLERLKEAGNLNQKISEKELDFLLKEEDHSMSIEEARVSPVVKSDPDLEKINSYLDSLLIELSSISKEVRGIANST